MVKLPVYTDSVHIYFQVGKECFGTNKQRQGIVHVHELVLGDFMCLKNDSLNHVLCSKVTVVLLCVQEMVLEVGVLKATIAGLKEQVHRGFFSL